MGVSFSINPTLPGDYTLIVTDANGCIDSSIVTIVPSFTSEVSSLENLNIYPNPSQDIFNISFDSPIEQNVFICIYNILGEIIITKSISDLNGSYSTSVNLEEFGKSIYFIEFKTDNLIINKKIVLE